MSPLYVLISIGVAGVLGCVGVFLWGVIVGLWIFGVSVLLLLVGEKLLEVVWALYHGAWLGGCGWRESLREWWRD